MDSLTEQADPCCERHWNRSAFRGELAGKDRWECPRCGMEYKPRDAGAFKVWEAFGWSSVVLAARRR